MFARFFVRFIHWIGVGAVVVLACTLYLPFLDNLPVFDDRVFFSGILQSYYATHPLGLALRLPPYFSLAIVQVISGDMEVHRLLSLALHIGCALALYKLCYDLQSTVERTVTQGGERFTPVAGIHGNAAIMAFFVAVVFAIHPVAVYGAGYLVQRTIVMATLFSLLSIIFFHRGLRRRSHADAISAALFYALAVLSKEHAILLPAVAVLVVFLVRMEKRFALRHVAIYLALCAPAAFFSVLLSKGIIGEAYEPDFGVIASQMEGSFGEDITKFPLTLSAITQMGLFFKYLVLWLWPDTGAMSIDVRVDFLQTWSIAWIVLKIGAFIAFGVIGFLLLRRGGRTGLAGFGMLYFWILFAVEFSAARFQEPFVLYRSYFWAPGILLASAAFLSMLARRIVVVAAAAGIAIVIPVLFYQAQDRLVSFSKPLLLWQDAMVKLPEGKVPWGSRTLYQLGREYLYNEQPDKAFEVIDRCIASYPTTVQCLYARGAIHLQIEQYEQSLPYFSRAIELQPGSGIIYHRMGLALEGLGRIREAKNNYQQAMKMGYAGAGNEILRLESPGRGLSSRGKPGQVTSQNGAAAGKAR